MNEDPCEKERQEFREATEELIETGNEYLRLLPKDFLVKSSKPSLLDWKDAERLNIASKHEEQAREKYFSALKALGDCENRKDDSSSEGIIVG